jgi:hypothetical protein
VWIDFLQYCESEDDVRRERRRDKVRVALETFSDSDVWAEIQRRGLGFQPPVKGLRDAEIESLLESPNSVGDDVPEGVFFARSVQVPGAEPELTRTVTKVIKVHRLREVIVQVGFTRFDSAVPDVNGELSLDVERAALSMNQTWLPAVENRGEGVFIGFDKTVIETWRGKNEVQARTAQLKAGFDAWKANRINSSNGPQFPGPEYIMLHTLAHLLITAVALDCGYAGSSIRERIYAGTSGYGILLYTASPDAEGTLGGLVEAADRIDRYLRQAVDLGRLCANDPVCAQHRPNNRAEDRLLAGAACHGCVLLAESSCERRNDFLDRALVVSTVDGEGSAFFNVA